MMSRRILRFLIDLCALVVVVFALMAHGEDCDGMLIFDFEQGDVAGIAEGNDRLAQERVVRFDLPA